MPTQPGFRPLLQSCYGIMELPGPDQAWLCSACEQREDGKPPPQVCNMDPRLQDVAAIRGSAPGELHVGLTPSHIWPVCSAVYAPSWAAL
jgi:hypothetical protein